MCASNFPAGYAFELNFLFGAKSIKDQPRSAPRELNNNKIKRAGGIGGRVSLSFVTGEGGKCCFWIN